MEFKDKEKKVHEGGKEIGLPVIGQTEFGGRIVFNEAIIEKIPGATVP